MRVNTPWFGGNQRSRKDCGKVGKMSGKLFLILCSVVVLAAVSIGSRVYKTNDGLTTQSFTFVYRTTVNSNTSQEGMLEVWVPLPITDPYQDVISYEINSKLPYDLYLDSEYGNRILHFSRNGSIPESLDIEISMNIRRIEQDGWNQNVSTSTVNEAYLQQYLLSDALVPIDGPIAKEADQVVRTYGAATDINKAEALYNHLVNTMKYDKTGLGWGNGDALYACEARSGNCTDIHSLFIGMARSQGIPSRFVMGFPVPDDYGKQEIPGYHCWAEFYVEGHGWVPVDISEAIKRPEKQEYFFGRVDANRVAFTIGRDIRIATSLASETLNYFIYPHVLVNNKPFSQVKYNFTAVRRN